MNRSDMTPRSYSSDQLRAALDDVGGHARPDYLDDIVARAGRTRQRPRWTFPERWLSTDIAGPRQRQPRTAVLAVVLVLLALLALAASAYVGSRLTRPVDLGIAEPTPGRIDCGNPDHVGAILGCSRDGTRLLIQKGVENLFILDADGSETQVTEQLTGFDALLGSSRPAGATISPDGSRIVFAGLTTKREEWRSCHDGALFAVAADGGPAELLWRSHVPQNGIVMFPTFSPDGTRIAFTDGYCDSSHSVWVMNADGSDAHQVLVPEDIGLEAGHVHGLAWTPAGDRIALIYEGGVYTFATDGSDFRRAHPFEVFCWPGNKTC